MARAEAVVKKELISQEDSKTMADSESASNTGVVAILVIFLIVVIAAFFAWRGGMFGGKKTEVDINVSAPSAPSK